MRHPIPWHEIPEFEFYDELARRYASIATINPGDSVQRIAEKLTALTAQRKMIMTTVAQLDTALDQLGAALTTAATAQAQAITDLEAAIAAGQTDVTAEVARVSAFTTQIAALGAAASAADPVQAVPAVPPATP